MKAVVFGYHNIGYVCLRELLAQGHEVAAVVTHEDDPAENVWFASVAQLAEEHHLPVFTPGNPNVPEFVSQIRSFAPDIIFSFYYRYMLKHALLAIPPLGALNLHGSYLPRYRGRCPVNWVLINGESETGVTLHYMVEEPDAGDIVVQRKVPISFEDTALTLYEKMTIAAEEVFAAALPALANSRAPRITQDDGQATYFGGRRPEDGRFEWSDTAQNIYNLVRAVTHPYPGAFTELHDEKLLVWWALPQEDAGSGAAAAPGTVLELSGAGPVVATGDGQLLLLSVQVGDGPMLDGSAFVHSYSLSVGENVIDLH